METKADETDGFDIEFDESSTAIRVKAWGFWSPEIAERFEQAIFDAFRVNRGATALDIDARGLKPQRDAGVTALGTMMQGLHRSRIARVSVKTDSSLTRLQFIRIAKEHDVTSIVQCVYVAP